MKELIVVAKYYPPMNNARSLQARLFVRALCKKFKVTLITSGCHTVDELENLTVVRIESTNTSGAQPVSIFKRIENKLKKELGDTFGTRWSRQSGKELRKLTGDGVVNVISLSEPFDTHLAVLSHYSSGKINWLCFYSDPWPHSIMPAPYSNSALPILSWLQERRSKKVLSTANSILLTNTKAAKYIGNKLNLDMQSKSKVIRHFAPDVETAELCSLDSNFGDFIIHAGHLTKERVNTRFFEMLVKELSSGIKIVLAGRVCEEMTSLIESNNWNDNFVLLGVLDQGAILKLIGESVGVLLIEAEMEDSPFVPSKLAEFFNLNLTIISLTNSKSESAELINLIGNGVVVEHCMTDEEMAERIRSFPDLIISEESQIKAKSLYSPDHAVETVAGLLV